MKRHQLKHLVFSQNLLAALPESIGQLANLEVVLLDDMKLPHHSSSAGLDEVDVLDVRKARCFTEEDTVRLHKVIAATGYTKINQLVRDVFTSKMAKADAPTSAPSVV